MHEWALADAVVVSAEKAGRKDGVKRISQIQVGSGELQQISINTFLRILKEVIEDKGVLLKEASVNVSVDKAVAKCNKCQDRWSLEEQINELDEESSESVHFVPELAHLFIKCPFCKSQDFEVEKGRGIRIVPQEFDLGLVVFSF